MRSSSVMSGRSLPRGDGPASPLESGRRSMNERPGREEPELVRGLGAGDAALVTIGSVLGTGIFITTVDIARNLPHPGLILLAWIGGALFTLAAALTYRELGLRYPWPVGQMHI